MASTTITTDPLDSASLQFSVTVKGETKKLLEDMEESALRPLIAEALIVTANKANTEDSWAHLQEMFPPTDGTLAGILARKSQEESVWRLVKG
jgi:hypothetical protein